MVALSVVELVALVILNALIDTLIVLVLGVRRWKRQVAEMWNEKVELKDMDGSVIKIPVPRKVTKDGQEVVETSLEIGPLWLTVAYGLGTFAGQQLKMSALSAKGKMATLLNKAGFGEELKEAGIDAATAALIDTLPAKARPIALLVARALKGTGTSPGGQPGPTRQHRGPI